MMHHIHHLVKIANKEGSRKNSTLFQHILLDKVHEDLVECMFDDTNLFYLAAMLHPTCELYSVVLARLKDSILYSHFR
jgi:hypothetical protein